MISGFSTSRKLFFLSPFRTVLSAIHRAWINQTQVGALLVWKSTWDKKRPQLNCKKPSLLNSVYRSDRHLAYTLRVARCVSMTVLRAYSFCAVFLFRFINRNRNKRVQKEQFSSERNNFHGNKMAHSLISNRKGKKYEKIIRERSSKNTGGYFDKRNERKRRCFCVKKNKKLPTHLFVVVSPSDFRRVVGFPLR